MIFFFKNLNILFCKKIIDFIEDTTKNHIMEKSDNWNIFVSFLERRRYTYTGVHLAFLYPATLDFLHTKLQTEPSHMDYKVPWTRSFPSPSSLFSFMHTDINRTISYTYLPPTVSTILRKLMASDKRVNGSILSLYCWL